jgi:LysM repeat protein
MRKLLSLLLAMLAISLLIFPALAQDDQSANLLTNPGFEQPYADQEGVLPRQVADGWTAWNLAPENSQPEYAPASASNADRVREGDDAQLYFSFFSPHIAGVYQTVSGLTAGEDVTFSVYAYTFSSNAEEATASDDPCGVTVQVGIDPAGGDDPESDAIVWSEPAEACDDYTQYSISAAPSDSSVTVFVRSDASVGRLSTEVYLDEASLTVGTAPVGTDEVDATAEVTDETAATDEVFLTDVVALTDETLPTTNVVVTDEATIEAPVVTDEVVVTAELTEEPALTQESSPTFEIVTAEVTDALSATEELIVTEAPTLELITEEATDAGVIASATSVMLTEEVATDAAPENPTDFPTITPVIEATATPVTPTEIPATPTDDLGATQTTEAVLEDLVDEYPGRVEHTVRAGESVFIIANLYGSSVPAIITANGLNENALIFVGQRLVIPVRVPPATTGTAPAPTEAAATEAVPTATTAATTAPEITPTPTSTVTASPEAGNIYIVQRGDTLSQIARRFNTTVATLAQLNGIVNVNSILVGQRLTLPTGSGTMTPTPSASPTPTGEMISYVVLPGDSLYRLSLVYKVPIQEIAEINEISNINRIFVGQVLQIPQPAQ